MDILTYYLILCFSFSLMYSINYISEIVLTVQEVLEILDIEESDGTWIPSTYRLAAIFVITVIAPLSLLTIIFNTRYDIIKGATAAILMTHYGLDNLD